MTVLTFPGVDQEDPTWAVSSAVILAVSGITYRCLDHWTRAGYLQALPRQAQKPGYHRQYQRTEIAVACLMRDLIAGGILPQPASIYARELLEHGTTQIAGITVDLPQHL